MAFRYTLAIARKICRSYGMTIRRTGYGAEVSVYPKGKPNHPAAHFTDDLDDACGTARLMFKSGVR